MKKTDYVKPIILVSKCIEFDNCRFNGQKISSDFVKKLKKFVDFKLICPEVEIGLGVPRNPIKIVEKNNKLSIVQPETGKDVTENMNTFSENFLNDLEIDGAILKSKSPSCGIKNVKIYPSDKKSAPIRRDKGFFGSAVIQKFPFYIIESEDRLRNRIIKEHFLRTIFTFASFRDVKTKKNLNELIEFHTENKILLMSYNQKQLKKLGNIVSNKNKKTIENLLEDYEKHLKIVFSKSPRCTSNINVLKHTFGFISDNLKKDEKEMFLKSLDHFRQGKIGLSVPTSIIKSWIVRFDESYLKKQSYFNPYPEELMEVENVDFCASRDFWK